MNGPHPDRRAFLASSSSLLGGGWLALMLPGLSALSACARQAAREGAPLDALGAAEAAALAAFAARVLPTDDLPGATEAGAIHFIDRAIGGPLAELRPAVHAYAAELDARAAARGGTVFAALDEAGQDAVIRETERLDAFEPCRMLVVMGVFADASYGGNRDDVGWRLARMQPHAAHRAPFGWYDAEYARNGGVA